MENAKDWQRRERQRLWRECKEHGLYYFLQSAALCAIGWWFSDCERLPWPGVAVAVVAGLAALMSVHPNVQPRHKLIYLVLIGALLFVEFRAMKKDRDESQNAQHTFQMQEDERLREMLEGERQNTGKLLDQENKNLSKILLQDQEQFTKTISALLSAHRQDETHFAGVVQKEEGLLDAQRSLSEQFVGRLVPGDLPTPSNACSKLRTAPIGGNTLMVFGTSAVITDHLPTGMIEINQDVVLAADKIENSPGLALDVEMRDKDGTILFRINKDGMVNPRGAFLVLRPDKSTLLLQDPYGREFFRAALINPNTVTLSGSIVYCGRVISVEEPNVQGLCVINPRVAGIMRDLPFSCPAAH